MILLWLARVLIVIAALCRSEVCVAFRVARVPGGKGILRQVLPVVPVLARRWRSSEIRICGTSKNHNNHGHGHNAKNNARNMALKIGSKLATPPPPPSETSTPHKNSKTNSRKHNHATTVSKNKKRPRKDLRRPPVISWGRDTESFFWPPDQKETPKASSKIKNKKKKKDLALQFIPNKQAFPLIHLKQVLSPENLEWVLSQSSIPILHGRNTSLPGGTEELEQHERISSTGKVRTVRRSIVSRLDSKGELLADVLSNLPRELVAGGARQRQSSRSDNLHPYEDGSIVYYRTGRGDFYEAHHDSYASGETHRDRQRAFTVLVYLRTPPGPPRNGGTEFPRLTCLEDNHHRPRPFFCGVANENNNKKNGKQQQGMVVKPSAGDALVWPNFDRNGNPYTDSVHRALPVAATDEAPQRSRGQRKNVSRTGSNEIGKVVMNIWFEGFDNKIQS